MKLSIFFGILIALLGVALIMAAAPLIGLDQSSDFLLLQLIGIHRGAAFGNALMLAALLCTLASVLLQRRGFLDGVPCCRQHGSRAQPLLPN